MSILTQVTEGMQDILTEISDIIGRETKFIQRQRKLSGSSFVQTLVFGWLSACKRITSLFRSRLKSGLQQFLRHRRWRPDFSRDLWYLDNGKLFFYRH